MTPFLYCKKAEIPGGKGKPAIRAAVSHAPTGGLLVSLPRDSSYSSDVPVEMLFYDPVLGIVRCRCRLSAPVPSGQLRVYRCQVMEQLSREQRREDLKITLSAPVRLMVGDSIWDATIHNISASGVLLVTSLPARKGDRLTFDFNRTETPVRLTAQVLRVELRPPVKGKMAYGYGCRFVDLKPQAEALLRSYVFQEERRLFHSYDD